MASLVPQLLALCRKVDKELQAQVKGNRAPPCRENSQDRFRPARTSDGQLEVAGKFGSEGLAILPYFCRLIRLSSCD
nr:uncharacterized protein CTRU02_02506 [Colletotrichum truncatum]KAF6798532.1 hypothetical protein CTRU02_02506 [Colletotrichum truncatum]